jgi:FAD/FMN-containing dehydrogenase
VVKNVAGYDLMKLLMGSLGELGIVVEATFKVLPRPRASAAVLLPAPDAQDRRVAVEEIARTLAPAGLWRFHLGAGECLLAWFAGPPTRVAFQVGETRACGGNARAPGGDAAWRLLGRLEAMTRPDERATAWGGALPGFLARADLGRLAARSPWIADLLRGHLWLGDLTAEQIASVRESLRSGEGHLHRDAPEGTFLDEPWGWMPDSERDLWQGMQAALDPTGHLVRGRLPGGV